MIVKPMPRLAAVEKPGTRVARGRVLKSIPGPSSLIATCRQSSRANAWYAPPPACLSALSSASPTVLSRSRVPDPAGEARLGGADDPAARRRELRRRAEDELVAERRPELVGQLLVREEDQLAAGDGVQHVHVGVPDALLLPAERPLRLAQLRHVGRGEHPEVVRRRIRREQLVGAVAAQVHLAARRAGGGDRAGHEVEVGAQPLVAPVALAEPPAEQLLAGGPRAPRLRRVEVDDDEVAGLTVRARLDAEDGQTLRGVVEEPPVPLLALDEQRVLALVLQRLQAHLAEHAHEVGEEPHRLLQVRVGDDGHAVERLEIRGLVEPQTPRPLGERRAVHVVVLEEELAGVHVGHVLAGHDQRERHVPQAVAAAVRVVLGLAQSLDADAG